MAEEKRRKLPAPVKITIGSLTGMLATTLDHPLDVIKVRVQLSTRNWSLIQFTKQMVICEGYRALYVGYTAALFRQATNTTSRYAVFNMLSYNYEAKTGMRPGVKQKVKIGIYAGLVGSFIGTPADIALVRMMTDRPKDPNCSFNKPRLYKGVFHTLRRIYREEGLLTLWKGGPLNSIRSVLLSVLQIGTQADLHEKLLRNGLASGHVANIYSSVISTTMSSVITMPVDALKTQYQVDRNNLSQTEILRNMTSQGLKGLWRGFLPYFLRQFCHTVLTVVFYEESCQLYFVYSLQLVRIGIRGRATRCLLTKNKRAQRKNIKVTIVSNNPLSKYARQPVALIRFRYMKFSKFKSWLKRGLKMFNLYQHMKQANSGEGREVKEPETTGHDRFYQGPRTSYRKKKRRGACRRAQSAAELNPESIAAANKRNAFRIRSVSTEKDESEEENSEKAPLVAQKIDSLAKLLFNKSIIGTGSGKSSPSEAPASPKVGLESSMESAAALSICTEYLSHTSRYDLISPLNTIGSRPNKHWFAVHDYSIKTDRLLILMPLTSKCPIDPSDQSRTLIMELFRALHHPYIYPVLDLELFNGHALAVMPFNARGSLKDLIYKSTWNEDYSRKYGSAGAGLPAWQVARFGRQMLEGLLFLKEKGFPSFRHLHSGNVMVQNGVARICGLENTLIGAAPRAAPLPPPHAEALSLGRVLVEMCAGTEQDLAALPDLSTNYPHVVEIIELIFGPRTPTLHELLLCELFRKIDLREMKGSCLPNFSQRLSRSCLSLLGEVSRRQPGAAGGRGSPRRGGASPATPPPRRRHFNTDQDYTEDWQW